MVGVGCSSGDSRAAVLQLVPGDRDQNGLLGPLDRSTHVAVPDECTTRLRTFSTGDGCGDATAHSCKNGPSE